MATPWFSTVPVVLVVLCSSAAAQDGTWEFPVNGVFSDAAKWENGVVPGPDGHATFGRNPGGPFTVTFGQDAASRACWIWKDKVVFDLAGHGYALSEALNVGLDDSNGALTIGNGKVSCSAIFMAVGGVPSVGEVTVSGAGASLESTILGGCNIGSGLGNDATLTIEDGASCVLGGDNFSEAIIGRDGGKGSLVVADGGTLSVTTHPLLIGIGAWNDGTPAIGEVTVSSGASISLQRYMNVGRNGVGTLTIVDGGAMSAHEVSFVGDWSDGDGAMTVSGPGSKWTGDAELIVGAGTGGEGSLTVNDGAEVTARNIQIGRNGTGTATISGAGTTVTGFGSVAITDHSIGHATIEAGATASCANPDGSKGFAFIGEGVDSVGHATVTGQGTVWKDIDWLIVSGVWHTDTNGEGHVTVEDGGRIECNQAYIGAMKSLNHGFVTVRGPGSVLVADGAIGVGEPGTGELSLLDRGHTESTNFALGSRSTLRIGVGPDGAGHAEASDIVLLDGTLEIVSEGKLKPGDSFVIATGAQIIGEFDQVTPADFTVEIGVGSVSVVYQACYGDTDGSDAFDLFDFLGFVNLFNAQDPAADCNGDGSFDLFDFLCFTNFFNDGC